MLCSYCQDETLFFPWRAQAVPEEGSRVPKSVLSQLLHAPPLHVARRRWWKHKSLGRAPMGEGVEMTAALATLLQRQCDQTLLPEMAS